MRCDAGQASKLSGLESEWMIREAIRMSRVWRAVVRQAKTPPSADQ